MAHIPDILSELLLKSFDGSLMSMYSACFTKEDLTPEAIRKYIDKCPFDAFDVNEKDGGVDFKIAPPYDDTPAPTAKYVAPMDHVREYVQGFTPVCPYNEETGEMITTEKAIPLGTLGGSVVYSHGAIKKPVKPLYSAATNFINLLEGNVLIIGDNKLAVAGRTRYKHWYMPIDPVWRINEIEFSVQNHHKLINDEGFNSLINRIKFDHVVYLFSRGKGFVVPNARHHYLGLITGSNSVCITSEGDYSIEGKVVTLHSKPSGSLVCHTSLCPAFHPLDYSVVWYTDLYPTSRVCSLVPLSNFERLGSISDVYLSDKLDGIPWYIEIKRKIASLYEQDALLPSFSAPTELCDQLLICERLGNTIMVCEPLYHVKFHYFAQWVKSDEDYSSLSSRMFKIFRKDWIPFSLDYKWHRFAASGEGIVIKSGSNPIGMRLFHYEKIATYYVKLPERASYEDKIECISSKSVRVCIEDDACGGCAKYFGTQRSNGFRLRPPPSRAERESYCSRQKISDMLSFRGVHDLYQDSSGCYKGDGVYEVLVHDKSLYRRRDKIRPDPKWYVEAVSAPLQFAKIFSAEPVYARYDDKYNSGVSQLMTTSIHRVKPDQVDHCLNGKLIAKVAANIGDVLYHDGNQYIVQGFLRKDAIATIVKS
jgi:hypothetical protein